MAGFELDAVFCKGLKLLHSNSKESADQLMHLLEEVLDVKYGGTKSLNLKLRNITEEPTKNIEVSKPRSSRGPSPVQSVPPSQTSEKSSRNSSPASEPVSSRTTPDLDDEDLALEIFEDELRCTVCKDIAVGPKNNLVECSDCHLLYHQECHKPTIPEADVNDPRVVWYCSECVKKTQEKVQSAHTEVTKRSNSHSESSVSKKSKSESSDHGSSVFKRSDKSSSSHSKSSSGGGSGSGMASLAASIQSSKPSSSSSSSSSSKQGTSSSKGSWLNYNKNPGSPNSKSSSSSSNLLTADKRLQNMKKKAAAKMQEKRSKHK